MRKHPVRGVGLVVALVLLPPWAGASPAPDQPATILRGVVVGCDGAPLSSVSVSFVGPGGPQEVGALTNSQGEFFVMLGPAGGTWQVGITRIGYAARVFTVTLTAGEDVDLGLIPVDCDHVRLRGSDPVDPGVFIFDGLVDDGGGFGCVNDRVFEDTSGRRSAVMPIKVNVSQGGGCGSEVAYFSRGHAAYFETGPPEWTPQIVDVVERSLADPPDVPLKIWLAVDAAAMPAALVQGAALAAEAQEVYRANRVGVGFTWALEDATAGLATIGKSCDDANTNNLPTTSWHDSGKINVYVVEGLVYVDPTTSAADPTAGVNCSFDRNVVFVDLTADKASLAHELGHAFGFRCFVDAGVRKCYRNHTDVTYTVTPFSSECPNPTTDDVDPVTPSCQPAACPASGVIADAVATLDGCQPFGLDNVMWPAVSGRSTFTLGQAYHMRVETVNQLRVNGFLSGTAKPCRKELPLATGLCPVAWLDP